MIAAEVIDIATHERFLSSRDAYRPSACACCGASVLHVHDYRERVLLADAEKARVRIVRYRCARCRAVWRILPEFVARHLWRSWRVVEAQTISAPPPRASPRVPQRTKRRWWARLRAPCGRLREALVEQGDARIVQVFEDPALQASREEVVLRAASALRSSVGHRFSSVARRVHEGCRWVRIM